MRIDILTGFPKIVEGPLNESIIKIGRQKGAVQIVVHNLRDYTDDKHKTIDDYPYGGGPGMVLKVEPIVRALDVLFTEHNADEAQIVLPSPRGTTLTQSLVTRYSLAGHLVIICGHYKGIDERVHDFYKIEEVSIGDYILSSGEIAALVLVDALVRLQPGVIKDIDSAWTDSFSDDLLDAPYYTRPAEFRGVKVPQVLTSGDHKKIEQWRLRQREDLTRKRRPDLYEKYIKINK
ncbi:MAG TPA: tRNA (guanosine(37)-N1)-methyltransferase TrmD [Caldithrix abyssi]|uniref:tRNA (guanine-N(1)-)-methyltransferase n=1 Tax=Caldithrix abyssi TaxID=187145 RepID=A0A7V4WUT1_CALAY|nr:tRNA (guanosine(37)-N1)-methyltransferase TrmD [Caldithrix abyssi]